MKHKIITLIGIIVIIVIIVIIGIIGASTGDGNKDKSNTASVSSEANSESAQKASNEVVAKVGDVIKTDKFEITITSIEERDKVGTEFINSKPSDGGTYVVVNWKYKNISNKPLGSFSCPTIDVLDKDKTKYDSDLGATSSYATEKNLDTKIMSDLNPGITVKDAEVFEIAKDKYKAGGWKLKIKADKEAFININ